MYAIIRTGGKQHRVAENDRIVIERLAGAPGDVVAFDDVLMLAGAAAPPLIGAEVPDAARVFGEVLAQ
ncbi:MAG TPA: 50S ribosomal protein L21, partial [Candidatus Defluviicoccus seviourii]|nr:50S ribosomal protein L21 [Candidatus Defluviicoccus seviourii]